MDGWIYLALGDQGIHDATGSDGRKLQHRGGGVMRFRPDGSQMEMWAVGTRNIYGVAISPTLDIFARDNTNDGGGWNVRFHHMSGMTDHGYPSLFLNFEDEIDPAARGFRRRVRHRRRLDRRAGHSGQVEQRAVHRRLRPHGPLSPRRDPQRRHLQDLPPTPDGTPNITGAGQRAVRHACTNPMDVDLDANSNIYLATWRGGGFGWTATPPTRGMIYKISAEELHAGAAAELRPADRGRARPGAAVAELQAPHRGAARDPAPPARRAGRAAARRARRRSHASRSSIAPRAIYTLRLARGTAAFADLGRLVADPSIAARRAPRAG